MLYREGTGRSGPERECALKGGKGKERAAGRGKKGYLSLRRLESSSFRKKEGKRKIKTQLQGLTNMNKYRHERLPRERERDRSKEGKNQALAAARWQKAWRVFMRKGEENWNRTIEKEDQVR